MRIIQPEPQYLIRLLSSVIDDIQPPKPPEDLDWGKLYKLSVWHSVSNMAWYGLCKLDHTDKPPQEILIKFQNDCKKAIAKEATQHITIEQVLKAFEENHIACMPLKGYLVKYLYPQPDMRLMADVDILIKSEQAGQAKKRMLALEFTVENEGGYHDSYYKKPFMNVEIHRRLISEDSPYSEYLSKTWSRAKLKSDSQYSFQLSREDFYIYLLVHLTKHYAGGGTGIRSFLDIWLYHRCYEKEMDWNYIQAELEKINLRKFAENILGLCEVWFGNAQSNELYDEMTDYILTSGVYGTSKHAIVSSMNIRTGKKYSVRTQKYLYGLKLFFPPMSTMKTRYPFLGALPILLPVSWILRGIRCLIFKRKNTFQKINKVRSVTGEDVIRIGNLQEKAGLKKGIFC